MAAAALLAVILGWYWLDGSARPFSSSPDGVDGSARVAGSKGPGGVRRANKANKAKDPAKDEYDQLRPQGVELDDPELVQLLVREVPNRIYSASAFCYKEEPGDREKIRFRFQVDIVDRIGTLRDVVVHSSNLNAPGLERCLESTLKKIKWTEKWAPDGEFPGEMEMTMRGLRQRSRFVAAIPR